MSRTSFLGKWLYLNRLLKLKNLLPIRKASFYSRRIIKHIFLYVIILIATGNLCSQEIKNDSIPIRLGANIKKSIYNRGDGTDITNRNYSKAWGKHYKDVYYKLVNVKSVPIDLLFQDFSVKQEIPQLHSVVLSKNDTKKLYLVRPLGGSSCFLESSFFKSVYHKADFEDTYLGDFISDAYTIVHPYAFIASDHLSKTVGLISADPGLFFISATPDTSKYKSEITDKMVNISELPFCGNEKFISNVDSLLHKLQSDNTYKLDQHKYIRTRLFDMLIGDWNKIPDSWYWIEQERNDSTIIEPLVIDRNHAFTKVDGFLFKGLLHMLGLNFIRDYNSKNIDIKKINSLGYALDVALTQKSDLSVWLEEAKFLKDHLTDKRIDEAFSLLPPEIRDSDTESIINNLKKRRNLLEDAAKKYYAYLQKIPSITGTNSNDKFLIKSDADGNTQISAYGQSGEQLFSKTFSPKQTKEIWLYGLEGDDTFNVDRTTAKIPILLIGGKGNNDYKLSNSKRIIIYESKSLKEKLDSLHARKVYPNDEDNSLAYDYQKLRNTKVSVTPVGLYDSDLGLNIGTSVAYTVYGFRRAPYTRRHQISWDYVNGFTYQGIFPDYDSRRSFHVSAYVGGTAYFSNFFGFGNRTAGYKNESKNFNRVNLSKYMVTPAFYYKINKQQTFNLYTSIQIYKAKNPKDRDRFINQMYEDDNNIFKTKYFVELGGSYKLNAALSHFVKNVRTEFYTGWIINMAKPGRNIPYTKLNIGINLAITDRVTFATLLKGTALYTNNYEFYQSATTELRGFRNNRFIGKQSLYQYSDVRLDMGKLSNPFTPLDYGVFVGFDHGRVWYPDEDSKRWHSSYGGGVWLTLFRNFTGKFSYFASKDDGRFTFQLGMGF